MEVMEIVERAKTKADLPSDYALAKAMGIERQVISQWRGGKRHPSNEEAVQLATLAGLDEMQVIAEIELRTAKNDKKKAFWQHYIESRSITACLTMTALACTIILTPEPAEASVLQLQNYGVKKEPISSSRPTNNLNIHYTYYYKRNKLILKALCSKFLQLITKQKINNVSPAIP